MGRLWEGQIQGQDQAFYSQPVRCDVISFQKEALEKGLDFTLWERNR
jgi:hypothetical protein